MGVKSRSAAAMNKEEIRQNVKLAWLEDGPADDGRTCGYFWLGGLMSDMTGSKAEAIAALAKETARPSLRFDYSGHGASGGRFTDGTVSLWLSEAVHMFERHTRSPRIVVGSSMGAWLALLLNRSLAGRRIAGLILIAPAVDMTDILMWQEFSPAARETITREGIWHRPSAYGDPYPITRSLIEDGRAHLMLGGAIKVGCPVLILQGDADADVPWLHGKRVYDALEGDDVRFILIKGGDHRLSSPRQLEFLAAAADELAARVP
jgi:pimeloyl-ACP methyl ester carboxylesterase